MAELGFGNDVLSIIFDCASYLPRLLQLYFNSPRSLYKVALVSRLFHGLAQKYLFRRLRITFALCWDLRNGSLIQRLEQDPTASASVHEIYINWAPGVIPRQDKGDGCENMDQLISLLPRLTHIKRIM
ncbi:MAG: hypothetical protein Q9184_000274 [Pyrenodesmia sp. 2 TL-2023]